MSGVVDSWTGHGSWLAFGTGTMYLIARVLSCIRFHSRLQEEEPTRRSHRVQQQQSVCMYRADLILVIESPLYNTRVGDPGEPVFYERCYIAARE